MHFCAIEVDVLEVKVHELSHKWLGAAIERLQALCIVQQYIKFWISEMPIIL